MLKKIILAAVVAATASFAQINFGVHAGLDMNTFWGDDTEDASSGIGFQAGAAAKISLPLLPITVAPEVLIDMRNFDVSDKVVMTEWALDIPVLVRFSLLPILYIEAGPEIAFNLSTTAEDDDGHEITEKQLEAIFPDFNTFEFDLVFGVGTGIVPFVDIDFRVILGMTSFFDDPEIGDPLDISNMQFALGATYWF
ncbi:MAG: PorT family protein [Fibrobacter sp.]|nr:PorT family protein [Fibrobacter sp.]